VRALAVSALACVLLPGCGDPCGDDPNCGAGIEVVSNYSGLGSCKTVPVASFMDAVWDAWCKPNSDCVGRLRPGDRFSDPEVCRLYVRQNLLAPYGIETLLAGVESGTVLYNKKRACSCLAAVAASCEETSLLLADASCNGIFSGTGNIGSACSYHGQCSGGSCRASLPPFSPSCPGTCWSAADEGGSCDASQACGPGLICRFAECVKADVGDKDEACGGLGCAEGLYCDWSAGGTCKAPLASGAECSLDDGSCPPGHYCAPAAGPTGKGRVCATFYGADQVCQMDAGPLQTCAPGHVCVGTCLTLADLGEACSHSAQCHHDAACVAGTCAALPGPGSACSAETALGGQLCKPPALCDPTTGKCANPPGEGKDCVKGQCAPGFGCVNGGCTTGPQHGQPCASAGKLCADGHLCIAGTCEKEVCE